jgi:hypothetical protein
MQTEANPLEAPMTGKVTPVNKKVVIVAGGAVDHIFSHLAIAAPAYGQVGRDLLKLCEELMAKMDINLHLTRMGGGSSRLESSLDLQALAKTIAGDPKTKIVFWAPSVPDFTVDPSDRAIVAGKYGSRLDSSQVAEFSVGFKPVSEKIVSLFRQGVSTTPTGEEVVRKDIFLVTFKHTCGLDQEAMYVAGLKLLKRTSSNLVLVNDVKRRLSMVIVPEEVPYHVTEDRQEALRGLVEMAFLRSHLTFTNSTVIAGEPVPWESPIVPAVLRQVVDHCIAAGAYKPVSGATAGHFAVKLSDTEFLTSRRKTNFNDMKQVGLVRIETDGPDTVLAYGSKPSVGGQSQRIVFRDHPGSDCIVHFHCPKREDSLVPTVSQREFECGSHQCGQNTSRGLAEFGNLKAVYLDQHGPNIVFSKDIDPQEVIGFIEANFDLSQKTGGYTPALA